MHPKRPPDGTGGVASAEEGKHFTCEICAHMIPKNMKDEIVLYQPNEQFQLEVQLKDETVWLTQPQIAALFGVQRPAVTKHLRNIFQEGELDPNSVSSILEHTAEDGKTYKVQFYNLDAKPSYINRNWVLKKSQKPFSKAFVRTNLFCCAGRWESELSTTSWRQQNQARGAEAFGKKNQENKIKEDRR